MKENYNNPNDLEKKKLQDRLEKADIDSVGKFMKMFDKMLLYTLAVNFLPQEAIQDTIKLWEKVVKKGIDEDVTYRTNFLESTPQGRLAKYRDEPDGEELRLHFLNQWELAKDIIMANLHKPDDLDSTDLLDPPDGGTPIG